MRTGLGVRTHRNLLASLRNGPFSTTPTNSSESTTSSVCAPSISMISRPRGQASRRDYTEHGISWNHWIGSTAVLRPDIRYEHAYDYPAYSTGTKTSQLMFAGDV